MANDRKDLDSLPLPQRNKLPLPLSRSMTRNSKDVPSWSRFLNQRLNLHLVLPENPRPRYDLSLSKNAIRNVLMKILKKSRRSSPQRLKPRLPLVTNLVVDPASPVLPNPPKMKLPLLPPKMKKKRLVPNVLFNPKSIPPSTPPSTSLTSHTKSETLISLKSLKILQSRTRTLSKTLDVPKDSDLWNWNPLPNVIVS